MNNKVQKFIKVLEWFFGICFIIGAISIFFSTGLRGIWSFIFFIDAGLFCIPVSFNFIESQLNLKLKSVAKYIIVIACWLIGALLFPRDIGEKNVSNIKIDKVQITKDSIKNAQTIAKQDSILRIEQERIIKANNEEQKKWESTKAGKIQKKHPAWSRMDCVRLANREIWIGMSLSMLKYLRGTPNVANPSNYGYGVKWQWCWYDLTPSCFYGGEDGIITSYN